MGRPALDPKPCAFTELRAVRLRMGVAAVHVARKLKLSRSMLSMLERGYAAGNVSPKRQAELLISYRRVLAESAAEERTLGDFGLTTERAYSANATGRDRVL
jgi:transcriptional regulator with XRE-family HTH domain